MKGDKTSHHIYSILFISHLIKLVSLENDHAIPCSYIAGVKGLKHELRNLHMFSRFSCYMGAR